MKRLNHISLLLLLLSSAAGAAGCSCLNVFTMDFEDDEVTCKDRIDNDSDGLMDCLDIDCRNLDICKENDEETCSDGKDNDDDLETDCDDNECDAMEACIETGAECGDGDDNDGDGDSDCRDSDCHDQDICRENFGENCKDDKDNDVDGITDCRDPDCLAYELCLENDAETCSDGIDNDEDEKFDCHDEDCQGLDVCTEDTVDECRDMRDNDLDTLVDCADRNDCGDFPHCLEEGNCDDGIDNDVDGETDCHDLDDCEDWLYCRETSPLTCSDGDDNDNDTVADCDDDDCFMTGVCPEDETGTCSDGNDNDGDGTTDCADAGCRKSGAGCEPADYSSLLLEDDLESDTMGEDWLLYDYPAAPSENRQSSDVSIGGGALHVSVAAESDSVEANPVREETGAYIPLVLHLWNAITDVEVDVRVPNNPAHVPAYIALALDATNTRPFVRKGRIEWEGMENEARHAALTLAVDGLGGVRLCTRNESSELAECTPEHGPLMPLVDIPEGSIVTYRISMDDDEIIIFQNGEERIRAANGFHPGAARLLFLGSTDLAVASGSSEMYLESLEVFQVAEDSAARIVYEAAFDSDPGWETENPEHCGHNDESGRMDVGWYSATEETCSYDVLENVAASRFQMRFAMALDEADQDSYFLPGLWEPAMHFEMGIGFATGAVTTVEGTYLVFRSCDGQQVSEDYQSTVPAEVSVTAGYCPERGYAYALFQDTASGTDLWSSVRTDPFCSTLRRFGFTTRDYNEIAGAHSSGSLDNVIITAFDD